MYESIYGLSANPFRIAPDPRFFYESSVHKRGLSYLRYGLHQGQGFVVVTGEPGTGKSMLMQTLLRELATQQIVVVNITNTNLEADDVLFAVASRLGVAQQGVNKATILVNLERYCIEQSRHGRRVLLIVDEAQNLPLKSLEELRMLSNFQLGEAALLQIMLLGQQQLREIMARPDMEQLTQRVIASCHLKPMNAMETRGYVEHRLLQVGWKGVPSFSAEALGLIYAGSHGVPRLINVFCDRILLAAALEDKPTIDAGHIRQVLDELRDEATGICLDNRIDPLELTDLKPLPEAEANMNMMASGEATGAVVLPRSGQELGQGGGSPVNGQGGYSQNYSPKAISTRSAQQAAALKSVAKQLEHTHQPNTNVQPPQAQEEVLPREERLLEKDQYGESNVVRLPRVGQSPVKPVTISLDVSADSAVVQEKCEKVPPVVGNKKGLVERILALLGGTIVLVIAAVFMFAAPKSDNSFSPVPALNNSQDTAGSHNPTVTGNKITPAASASIHVEQPIKVESVSMPSVAKPQS